jgi:hypothetical protein
MHSDWFNEIEILQGRWQHGGKVGYCYHSGLEKTLFMWEIYVPLVAKGLRKQNTWRAFKNTLFGELILSEEEEECENSEYGTMNTLMRRSPHENIL